MENKNLIISTNLPNVISGIDTLYYFYESNNLYDSFFINLLEQLEDSKKGFELQEVSFENKDLKVTINKQVFEFNGKAQGFYWFSHLDNFLSVGFKDSLINIGVHNIQIQFNAIGIYTLGLKTLLKHADDIFKDITTGYRPVTRADLNIFIQSDLSWLNKDMFVSRKRKYTSHIKEVSSKYRLQTLYIGKEPFLLRVYDKKEELKTSSKHEMMYQYFLTHGFNKDDDIFNIEFELHRKYLKSFSVDTIDDLLKVAEKLFKECMKSIRLVDLSTISKNSIYNMNRYKADTHQIWEHIKDSYLLKGFLADNKPLLKIKRPKFLYSTEQAIEEHIELANKAYMNDIVIDEQFYCEVLTARGKVCQSVLKGLYSQNKGLANDSAVGML
nr:hypothetical protein [uncultured Sulfurimonas sp.]